MQDFEAAVAAADHERMYGGNYALAIKTYDEAISIMGRIEVSKGNVSTSYNLRHVFQMIGVCKRLVHEYEESIHFFIFASNYAQNDQEIAHIMRDMAESFGAMERHSDALYLLSEAVEILRASGDNEHWAATLGFMAREYMRAGKYNKALELFAQADTELHAGTNRELELYNALHYASALSQCTHPLEARRKAWRGLRLSVHHGNPQHAVQALALLVGGSKLETWVCNHQGQLMRWRHPVQYFAALGTT